MMNSKLIKRDVSANDHALWLEHFDSQMNLSQFEKLFNQLRLETEQDKSYSFILENSSEVIGFIQVFNVLKGHTKSGMIEISITKAKRRLGYGKQAIQILEKFAFEELGLLRLIAPISADNIASLQLFKSLGYERQYTDPSAFFFSGNPQPHEIYIKLNI